MSQVKSLVRVSHGVGFHEISYDKDEKSLITCEMFIPMSRDGKKPKEELEKLARDELIMIHAGMNGFRKEQVRVEIYSMIPVYSTANA